MSSTVYFGSLPKEDIGPELMRRVSNWYQHISTSGMFDRMKKSYFAYFGYSNTSDANSSSVTSGGTMGELKMIKVNHFRNLVQHILVMTTNSRPAMECRAVNTDYRSMAQTILGNGILDYYMREKQLEEVLKNATEMALVLSEGYLRLEWDTSLGEEYDADPATGRIIRTGDLKFNALSPLDVIKDIYKDNPHDDDWKMVRHYRNKFDLAAKYPDKETEILSSSNNKDTMFRYNFLMRLKDESDMVPVYEFYHRKSEVLPEGRHVILVAHNGVLYDGPLPYREIPVYRIAPGEFLGTTYGYTPAFDLLAMQEILDALYSAVVTNQTTFGIQNIMLPKGHDISYSQLAGALNVIEYDRNVGKPEPLQLTATPPEVFNFIKSLESVMETLSGVNSVARGNPEPNLRSGNALALIQSMAIQFNSGLQQSYARLIENVGTGIIKTLKDFSSQERLVMITGKTNRTFAKQFVGGDLDKIDRVVVDMANPLSKTISGKVEIADNLLNMNMLKSPQQYLTLLKTGNLDSIIQGDLAEQMLIDSENENMKEGQVVIAIATDNHKTHVQEHKAVIADPEIRKNPAVIKVTLDHINEHIKLLKETDPDLLNIIGEQPLGQPPAGGAPGGGGDLAAMLGGAAPQGGPPPSPTAETMQSTPPDQLSAQQTTSMPTNPLSGIKFDPTTGGLPSQGAMPPNK